MLKMISVRELTEEEKEAVKNELREYLRRIREREIQLIRLERRKIAETITDLVEKRKFLKEPIHVKRQLLRIKFIVEDNNSNKKDSSEE
jgi:hypothetical protein